MQILPAQIDELVALIRNVFPGWVSFSDPRFISDELGYKRKASVRAKQLLAVDDLQKLISSGEFDEFVDRLDKAGQGNNLLWRSVPAKSDVNILPASLSDRPGFCRAVFDLLHGLGPSTERFSRYLDYVAKAQLPSKWPFPTYCLFMLYPETDIIVKPRRISTALKRLGLTTITPKPTADSYAMLVDVAHSLKEAMAAYGPMDMVDIQSALWVAGRSAADDDEVEDEGDSVPHSSKPAPRYWALAAGERARLWPEFQSEGVAGIGWDYLGDLRQYKTQEEMAVAIMKQRGGDEYPINDSLACYDFAWTMQAGDRILIKKGTSGLLGLGTVTSGYKHNPSRPEYHNIRDVSWEKVGNWDFTGDHSLTVKTLTDVSQFPDFLSYALNLMEGKPQSLQRPANPPYTLEQCSTETNIPVGRLTSWITAIRRKGQAIIYGPPGTGKSYLAERLARHLTADTDGLVELVQFHPAYGYEDFIQGIRPESKPDGSLAYPLKPGRLLEFCERARSRAGVCVLIIDEINRANLARVFGELMYLLEYRAKDIPLAGGGRFQLPTNVLLIGTMNTADRSIALVDHALRRRFAFLPLYPDFELLAKYHAGSAFPVAKLISVLEDVNHLIGDPHYALGISYFLIKDLEESLEPIWTMEIEPYLEEHFFDRKAKLAQFQWPAVKARLGL